MVSVQVGGNIYFYPRSPCGERLCALLTALSRLLFLSTLSLRRATDVIAVMTEAQSISIHALLAESDVEEVSGDTWARDFYPRSPCGERLMPPSIACASCAFLSTLSLRRATKIKDFVYLYNFNFYPRSPCGERLAVTTLEGGSDSDFYPRSPCGERPTVHR